ncbi:ATP-binding cassette domain-containing protein [Sporolactobacillus shoreicorticis]|uniref:ATP-binding cassette domain-containing protein n=1 Tax=Sporolactobacillus shoreicorticis TaxID=1923877 RepID=A0ABW5S667_9BACL|nr:AAA family ATPase [Sporolactobacillus shoreicorticis]MCO7126233.1 ATP-binding cassette domain-containing protein [Sporolactobacillus shoreicorticis]
MKIEHLNFKYKKGDRLVFDNLSFNLVQGKIHILLGRNGGGKSTLLDVLSGLLRVDAVILNPIPKNEILYQIQGVPILSTIKGKHLAELILCASGQYKSRDLSPEMCSELFNDHREWEKITYLWDQQYGKMSPGERRWLTIMLYCMLDKSLYLFDEPTAGVDPYSGMQIARFIRRLQEKKGKTVVYATHKIQDLNGFKDYRVLVLDEGKIVVNEDGQHWLQACKKEKGPFCKRIVALWENSSSNLI